MGTYEIVGCVVVYWGLLGWISRMSGWMDGQRDGGWMDMAVGVNVKSLDVSL